MTINNHVAIANTYVRTYTSDSKGRTKFTAECHVGRSTSVHVHFPALWLVAGEEVEGSLSIQGEGGQGRAA